MTDGHKKYPFKKLGASPTKPKNLKISDIESFTILAIHFFGKENVVINTNNAALKSQLASKICRY